MRLDFLFKEQPVGIIYDLGVRISGKSSEEQKWAGAAGCFFSSVQALSFDFLFFDLFHNFRGRGQYIDYDMVEMQVLSAWWKRWFKNVSFIALWTLTHFVSIIAIITLLFKIVCKHLALQIPILTDFNIFLFSSLITEYIKFLAHVYLTSICKSMFYLFKNCTFLDLSKWGMVVPFPQVEPSKE